MNKKKKTKKKELKNQIPKKIIFNNFYNFIIIISLLLFLISNVYLSQTISPLYEKLTNNDKKAIIDYLKKIKTLPHFKTELKKFTNIFGQSIVKEVFFDDEQRKIKIKKLEEALKKNPKGRDVLINLAILYKEDGNERLAQEYFNKAKEIDPMIK
jgi:tetratricopeptide (TPR) repeat protein